MPSLLPSGLSLFQQDTLYAAITSSPLCFFVPKRLRWQLSIHCSPLIVALMSLIFGLDSKSYCAKLVVVVAAVVEQTLLQRTLL